MAENQPQPTPKPEHAPDEHVYANNEEFLAQMREHRKDPIQSMLEENDKITYNVGPQQNGVVDFMIRNGLASNKNQAYILLGVAAVFVLGIVWYFFF